MSYNSYTDLYKIGEISFIGGSSIFLDFDVSSADGSPFNIVNNTFTWKLSPYGSKDYVVLTKSTPTLINENTIRFTLTSADTENLSGKYVQELTLVGNEIVTGEFTPLKLDFPLTAGAQPDVPPDDNVTLPSLLYVQANTSALVGQSVVITGYDIDDVATNETLLLNGTTKVVSTNVFSSVTEIDFPAQTSSGQTVTVGAEAQVLENVSEVMQGIVIIGKKLG